MTDKQLDRLVALQRLKRQLERLLEDMGKGYWVEVQTGGQAKLTVSDPIREDFRKFIQEKYDAVCKEFDEA